MTNFLLPVPTHTVGTDGITVQYDRQLIPYLTGLLRNDAEPYKFDPETGDPQIGAYYIQTLIDQLLTEVNTVQPNIFINPAQLMQGGPSLRLINYSNTIGASAYPSLWFQQSPPPLGNSYTVKINLSVGDWTIRYLGVKSNNSGIWNLTIDDNLIAAIDLYIAAPNDDDYYQDYSFTVTTPGVKTIALVNQGKNALGTGYYLLISGLLLFTD